MKTIEINAVVGPDRKLVVQLPSTIPPGEHHVVVVIDEGISGEVKPTTWDFPVIDVGPWPEGLSLRREDMYGDDGR